MRDAFLNFTGIRAPDLTIMLGDNAYNEGTDNEYQNAVFNTYPTVLRNSILWPTVGNHDARSSANSNTETGPYYDIFTLPRAAEAGGIASGTEAYNSFDYGNIHFICLESFEINRSPTGAMMTGGDSCRLGRETQSADLRQRRFRRHYRGRPRRPLDLSAVSR